MAHAHTTPAHSDPQGELAAAYAREHDLGCLACGYNIKGVESLICPECGSDMGDIALVRALHARGASIDEIRAAVSALPKKHRAAALPAMKHTSDWIARTGFFLGRFMTAGAFAVLVACVARRSFLPALYAFSAVIACAGFSAWVAEALSAYARGTAARRILAWSWLFLMIAAAIAAR